MQLHSQDRTKLEQLLHEQTTKAIDSKHDPAASSVAANNLTSCVYIALRCSDCGELRQALGDLPVSEAVLCPECGMTCSFVLLGMGLTSRQLPFYEIRSDERRTLNMTDRTTELASAFRHRQH